jgi:hypothetical protein
MRYQTEQELSRNQGMDAKWIYIQCRFSNAIAVRRRKRVEES